MPWRCAQFSMALPVNSLPVVRSDNRGFPRNAQADRVSASVIAADAVLGTSSSASCVASSTTVKHLSRRPMQRRSKAKSIDQTSLAAWVEQRLPFAKRGSFCVRRRICNCASLYSRSTRLWLTINPPAAISDRSCQHRNGDTMCEATMRWRSTPLRSGCRPVAQVSLHSCARPLGSPSASLAWSSGAPAPAWPVRLPFFS